MDYIVEMALNDYTDFKKFEEISTRILNDEGYSSIRAIGGIDDMGIDGEEIKYFKDGSERTIFQYSLDKRDKQKIIDTIEKLDTNSISFDSIVFVTLNQINNVQRIKADVRKKYNNRFSIDIIERKTILARLTASDNHLFNIYFPNIKAQIDSTVFNKKAFFSEDTIDQLQTSLLKCSLLFSFNQQSHSTRKELLDKLILSIIVGKTEVAIKEIKQLIEEKYERIFPESQIKSSIQSLTKEDYVKEKGNQISPTKKAITFLEGNLQKINSATEALISDIIEKVKDLSADTIDKGTISKLKSNIQNSLSAFFRLHGVDYASANANAGFSTNYGFDKNADLIKITKLGLQDKIGSLLVYAIGETIKQPTEEQSEVLSQWAKAFIGVQIMNLDPTLKEFQTSSFSKKTFIIDTDFLLYAIVDECEKHEVFSRLIKELKNLNCKLIIPIDVINEVLKHGEAEKYFKYFSSTFDKVDNNIIDESIHNVFVKGYYTGLLTEKISKSTSFKTYLSNYINKESPYDYLLDLIEYKFPKTFSIKELADISVRTLDYDQLEDLTNQIFELTKNTFKAKWRSDEENREVSLNDAKMYLTTYRLNKATPISDKSILPGDFYLLTSSTRAARCGLKMGLTTSISVKPEILITLLEQLGSFEMSSKEYINIFENPYLVEIVKESWQDIKILIDAGVDLKDKNPVNLQYELKDVIHKFLISKDQIDNSSLETDEKETEGVEINDFAKFAKLVKSKGYKFTPGVEKILDKFKEMEGDIKVKVRMIEELKKETIIFGARRKKYFDKLAGGKRGR